MEQIKFLEMVPELMKIIKEAIESFPVGEIFSVAKCIPSQFYRTLTRGNKSTLGSIFFDQFTEGLFPNVIYVGNGTSGSLRDVCLYKKIKG